LSFYSSNRFSRFGKESYQTYKYKVPFYENRLHEYEYAVRTYKVCFNENTLYEYVVVTYLKMNLLDDSSRDESDVKLETDFYVIMSLCFAETTTEEKDFHLWETISTRHSRPTRIVWIAQTNLKTLQTVIQLQL